MNNANRNKLINNRLKRLAAAYEENGRPLKKNSLQRVKRRAQLMNKNKKLVLLIGISQQYNVRKINPNKITRRNAMLSAFKHVRTTWPKNLVPFRNKELFVKLYDAYAVINGEQVLNKMMNNKNAANKKKNNNYAAWAKAHPAAANNAAREANLQWMINGHAMRY
jgi:UDP-2,3-diacylglucosamine pyrophosphatase LpxH